MRLDEFDTPPVTWEMIVEAGVPAKHKDRSGHLVGSAFFYQGDTEEVDPKEVELSVGDISEERFSVSRAAKHAFSKIVSGGKNVKAAIAMFRKLEAEKEAGNWKYGTKSPMMTAASMFNLAPREFRKELNKAGLI